MGEVIAGPWKSGGQEAPVPSVPSSEPSNTDRLIINEVNKLYQAFMQLEQRVARLEGGVYVSS